jgi:ribosomal protein S18 acetylase RimI-like enzyme
MKYPTEWESVITAKNGMRVKFRPCKSEDTEMLWEMFSTLSENSVSNLIPPFTREMIEGWTSNIDYEKVLAIVALIEEDGKQRIVGDASLEFNPNAQSKHKAGLGIAVHDKYQNMGIGTALLRHLLNIAKMKKLSKVWLEVNTSNDVAIHIYRKVGFQIEGKLIKERFINGKYRDEYRMAILL